jgi:hypothetical protein
MAQELDFGDEKLTANQKDIVINKLRDILLHERQNAPKFKYENYTDVQTVEFGKRFFKYFKAHEELIQEFYPPANDAIFQLSDKSFINELKDYLVGLETAKASDYKINDHKCDKIFAAAKLPSAAAEYNFNQDYDNAITFFKIKQHPTIQKLHKIVRGAIKDDIKSPFSIVNTRAWTTSPKTAHVGVFKNHTDHFCSGHLKIMVYLNPMNKDYGYIIFNENEIIDQPAGTCILFRNSMVEHRGVPGKTYDRVCIEITIQRTFVNLEQCHDGHPIGRHYASLNTALTENSEDKTIIFRRN